MADRGARRRRWVRGGLLLAGVLAVVPLATALAQVGAGGKPGGKAGTKAKAEPEELKSNPAAEAKLVKKAGDGFKLKRTAHYVIAYDTDDATLKAFVNRVEVTYKSVVAFAGRMGVKVETPKEKLQIIFCNEFSEYQAYSATMHFPASEESPGFYEQQTNRSAFFNYANASSLKKMREDLAAAKANQKASRGAAKADMKNVRRLETRVTHQPERINCLIVQHEIAHQVFYNIGLHVKGLANPRWFVEGLAMMFETSPGKNGAGIGAVNEERLGNWLMFRKANDLPPLKTLITEPTTIMPGNPKAINAYAQAWSMVHFLERNKLKSMATYINAIRARKDNRIYKPEEELATFESAFGPLNDEFEVKWEKFIKKIPFKPIESGL